MIGPGGVRYPVTPDIERFLRSRDRDALQSLVLEMAGYSPEAMRSLQLRATPEDEPTASELLAAVDAALAGVDLDYHDPSTKTSTTASMESRMLLTNSSGTS